MCRQVYSKSVDPSDQPVTQAEMLITETKAARVAMAARQLIEKLKHQGFDVGDICDMSELEFELALSPEGAEMLSVEARAALDKKMEDFEAMTVFLKDKVNCAKQAVQRALDVVKRCEEKHKAEKPFLEDDLKRERQVRQGTEVQARREVKDTIKRYRAFMVGELRKHKGITVGIEELPDWICENPYLRTGYRLPSYSFQNSIRSLAYLHNESVNIELHLEAAKLFAIIPILLFVIQVIFNVCPTADLSDLFVMSCFFLSVTVCFLLSAACHTLCNVSAEARAHVLQLDYFGIICLMFGSLVPTLWYGFQCNRLVFNIYLTVLATLAFVCAYVTALPNFHQPGNHRYRTSLYASVVPFMLVFIYHAILLYGEEEASQRMALKWIYRMVVCDAVGALFYVARVPEKWYPVRFDIFGASHQIFHFMVVLAALAHMIGLFEAFQYAHAARGQCFA